MILIDKICKYHTPLLITEFILGDFSKVYGEKSIGFWSRGTSAALTSRLALKKNSSLQHSILPWDTVYALNSYFLFVFLQIVNLIEETGHFHITNTTFDFDLCSLDKTTVRKLQSYLEMSGSSWRFVQLAALKKMMSSFAPPSVFPITQELRQWKGPHFIPELFSFHMIKNLIKNTLHEFGHYLGYPGIHPKALINQHCQKCSCSKTKYISLCCYSVWMFASFLCMFQNCLTIMSIYWIRVSCACVCLSKSKCC